MVDVGAQKSAVLLKKSSKQEYKIIGVIYLGDIRPGDKFETAIKEIMDDPEEKRNTVADLMQLRREVLEEFSDELGIRKKDILVDTKKFRLVTSPEIAEKLSFVMENCAIVEEHPEAEVQVEFL